MKKPFAVLFVRILNNCLVSFLAVSSGLMLEGETAEGIQPQQIIGGQYASLGEFPFETYLSLGSTFCTGSIIAPTWILTAAHCVVNHDGSVVDPRIVKVERGYPDDFEQIDKVERVIPHPDYYYQGAGFRYDVALIEMRVPFESDVASPVKVLTPQEEAWNVFTGVQVTALGYGLREDDAWSDGVRKVSFPVYTPADCRSTFEIADEDEIVHDLTLCAGSPGKRINRGDSGGPLLVRLAAGEGSQRAVWGQIGVASIRGNASSGEHLVSVFTRLSAVHAWIERVTKGSLVLPGLRMGTASNREAVSEIVITNNDSEPCSVDLLFLQQDQMSPPSLNISFNGRQITGNRSQTTIPGYAARMFMLTSAGAMEGVAGYILPKSGCSTGSLHVTGGYRIIGAASGEILDVISESPQSDADWMRSGDCRILTSSFGTDKDVSLAIAVSSPNQVPPGGAELSFGVYDWFGNFVRSSTLALSYPYTVVRPWTFSEPRIVKMCLSVPNDHNFSMAVSATGVYATGGQNEEYAGETMFVP